MSDEVRSFLLPTKLSLTTEASAKVVGYVTPPKKKSPLPDSSLYKFSSSSALYAPCPALLAPLLLSKWLIPERTLKRLICLLCRICITTTSWSGIRKHHQGDGLVQINQYYFRFNILFLKFHLCFHNQKDKGIKIS